MERARAWEWVKDPLFARGGQGSRNKYRSYAKLHNISVTAAIEKAISLFLQKVQPKQKLLETAEFNDALSYVKTLKAKGGKPIPADENSLDALVDKKYAL